MKRMGIVVVALSVLGLPACATQSAATSQVPAESRALTNVDIYYNEVYRNAERRGLLVQWVNPPTEKDLDEYDFSRKP